MILLRWRNEELEIIVRALIGLSPPNTLKKLAHSSQGKVWEQDLFTYSGHLEYHEKTLEG